MKRILKITCLFSLLTIGIFGTEQKVVLISGSSGGIGSAIANVFYEKGWKVWAGSRQPSEIQKSSFRSIYLDVANPESIKDCMDAIIQEDGKIDVLVNNAGYGIIGAEETTSLEETQNLFDVNFFGALGLIQAALPYMREKHSGHIINMSSTSGVRAVPGLGLYAASKFALEALSESLAVTLSPWNIQVSIVEPGSVKNDWAKHCTLAVHNEDEPIYTKMAENLLAKLALLAESGQSTDEIAALVLQIAETEKPHMRYQTSQKVKDTLSKKLVDLSGDEMRDQQMAFFKSLIEVAQ